MQLDARNTEGHENRKRIRKEEETEKQKQAREVAVEMYPEVVVLNSYGESVKDQIRQVAENINHMIASIYTPPPARPDAPPAVPVTGDTVESLQIKFNETMSLIDTIRDDHLGL